MDNIPIISKIKISYHSFSEKEKLIADLVIDNPKQVSRMTINEIAEEVDIAPSTVYQFTRKLGCTGFKDFRNELLAQDFDSNISIHENIESTDDAVDITRKVFNSSIQSLRQTNELINSDQLEEAIKFITEADTVSFFGVGGSNAIAFDAYHKFLRSPIHCQYSTDAHIQRMQASLMSENDCAIVITHTGITKDTLEIAQTAKQNNAKVIAITSYPSSAIKKYSDVLFVSISEETNYRSESLSSRISQLAIIDSLFTIVMFSDEERTAKSLGQIRRAIEATKLDE